MLIINKQKKHIFDSTKMTEIYIDYVSATKISYKLPNTDRAYLLEEYNDPRSAQAAMSMLCDAFGKYEKFQMPDGDKLKAYIIQVKESVPHAGNGKKTVRRGGS